MPKKIDPTLAEILKKHGANPETDIWDCHGTWVAYHRTLEKIAASAGVRFDEPKVIESDSQMGVAALCVTGRLGDRAEWSIGEAAPKNNKNAYPYAMAEKRAKDRVIIKLIGLHGVYSEDEADDFKRGTEPPTPDAVPTLDSEQIEALDKALTEVNANRPKLFEYFKINNLWELPADRYAEAMSIVEKKRKAAA